MKLLPSILISICSLIVLSLSACGGGGGSDSSSANTKSETGTLSVNITDAPVDGATEVVVKFNAIELKPKQGNSFTLTFDQPQSIDLLALQNGDFTPLLQNQSVAAGEYLWMRLDVEALRGELDSYISFTDGAMYSLYVPSGNSSGLKLNRGFIVPAGGNANFTIDFDLRKSVHKPGNNSDDYFLRPSLRIEDNTEVGGISGYIAADVVSDESCTEGLAVYAYSGAGVTADDEGSATSPLTSAMPKYDNVNDRYDYSLGFLVAGEYTVAITCDADLDDPEIDEDESSWSALISADATVSVDQTTELNFQ